jgi:hypothetical protein
MSYDFQLFRPRAGEDPYVTAQRDSEEFADSPPDPQKEALKHRVADALIAHNPKLAVFQFGYEEIAKFEKITVEQARLKYPPGVEWTRGGHQRHPNHTLR